MTAHREHEIPGVCTIRAEIEPKPRPVYFTDMEAKMTLHIENLAESRLVGEVQFVTEAEQTIGPGNEPLNEETWKIDIPPEGNDSTTFTRYGVGLQGNVALGIRPIQYSKLDDGAYQIEEAEVNPAKRGFIPLMSMTIWDRDFYRVNYLRPRRAQYLSVLLAFLSVVFAAILVWSTLI